MSSRREATGNDPIVTAIRWTLTVIAFALGTGVFIWGLQHA